jgi:hypothetical protein
VVEALVVVLVEAEAEAEALVVVLVEAEAEAEALVVMGSALKAC